MGECNSCLDEDASLWTYSRISMIRKASSASHLCRSKVKSVV